jgi:HEPN domain-containing protein
MPNKTYALEWMELAIRNLETARLLIREKHFTDSIAIEIQQSLEKAFKAVFAYYGERIPKSHSLPLLYNFVNNKIKFPEVETVDMIRISDYYETDRYPGPKYFIPARKEVEEYFSLAEQIVQKIMEHFSL